jgi:hypothetical protein
LHEGMAVNLDDVKLLAEHAGIMFEKSRTKFLVRRRVSKHRETKTPRTKAPKPAPPELPPSMPKEPPTKPPTKPSSNPPSKPNEPPSSAKPSTKPPSMPKEPPSKPNETPSKPSTKPPSQKPQAHTCDWNYANRTAWMKFEGKLVVTTNVFQEQPSMGQSSPVLANFADIGVARVAAIYWGVVAAPKGSTAVFRDFKTKQVTNNT